MEVMRFFQTTGALSGLVCLMILLYSVKRQLKKYAR